MNTYNVSEFARLVRRSVKTLQRWDREKSLIAYRNPQGRRYYTQQQLDSFLGVIPHAKRVLVYVRVSTQAQKPDLLNQRQALEQFCITQGHGNPEFIQEIGGGLNFKRKKFLEIMDAVGSGQVSHLIVAHKDRLVRFGFDWFSHYCEQHGCQIVLLNAETLSPEEEMVNDLMSIVHCFSSRLYGLRKYKKTIAEVLHADLSTQDSPDAHV
jgi:predicted site-specific integrase-resolvase